MLGLGQTLKWVMDSRDLRLLDTGQFQYQQIWCLPAEWSLRQANDLIRRILSLPERRTDVACVP
jgi:hypothetical protein